MYQFPFMAQQGTGPRIPASQGSTAQFMQGMNQQTLMEKQLAEQKKRNEQGLYFDIANTIFKGLDSIGGLLG